VDCRVFAFMGKKCACAPQQKALGKVATHSFLVLETKQSYECIPQRAAVSLGELYGAYEPTVYRTARKPIDKIA
jgi:hypothetical protein